MTKKNIRKFTYDIVPPAARSRPKPAALFALAHRIMRWTAHVRFFAAALVKQGAAVVLSLMLTLTPLAPVRADETFLMDAAPGTTTPEILPLEESANAEATSASLLLISEAEDTATSSPENDETFASGAPTEMLEAEEDAEGEIAASSAAEVLQETDPEVLEATDATHSTSSVQASSDVVVIEIVEVPEDEDVSALLHSSSEAEDEEAEPLQPSPEPEPAAEPTVTPEPEPAPTFAPTPEPVPTEEPIDLETLRDEIRNELKAQIARELEPAIREGLVREYEQKLRDATPPKNLQLVQGFQDEECTLVSENELYCSRADLAAARETAEAHRGVASRKDAQEGDLEIFIERGGDLLQLTRNATDDAFPVRDEKSGLIAWQGIVNEVWQIFLYDERTGTMQQLTAEDGSSINVQVSDGAVVWQTWTDGNWEVFMARRNPDAAAGAGWTMRRLTENAWHDVNPRASPGFVLWESYIDNAWQVYAHDLARGVTEQVSSGKGTNKNPRLAILWESEEGERQETLQYDIATGEVTAVSAGEPKDHDPPPALPDEPPNKQAVPAPPAPSGGGGTPLKNENDE